MNNSPDATRIRKVIGFYEEGMRTGNLEILSKGFHPVAILSGYLGEHLIAAPIQALYDWVQTNPAPAVTGEPFSCTVLAIEVTGRVAIATVRETSHEGDVIDYFHFLKEGDRWWIVSKLWDAEEKPGTSLDEYSVNEVS